MLNPFFLKEQTINAKYISIDFHGLSVGNKSLSLFYKLQDCIMAHCQNYTCSIINIPSMVYFPGIGRCLTYTPSLILVNEYFNKRRGLAVGISTAGVGLGMFTFPPLIEALFVNYGYKGAMIILTGVCCEAFVAAALFMPIQKYKKIVEIQRINR